jgi:serine/threonine protein kinase
MKTAIPQRPFVLLDFGIAFAINETNLTVAPTNRPPLGTWRYMAPEMLRPNFRDNISFRSDLYTTAQTVFEYAVGQHPLAKTADDLVQTISRIIGQEASLLEDKRPDLPRPFCNLINQMMKKAPALRPGNLDLLVGQVEAIQ